MADTTSTKPQPPASSRPKAKPSKHVPRPLERLFQVDTSRALDVQLPTRYDPYYRFPDKPAVYAPYDSDVLEAMSKPGATAYSLTLSEDSKCWRLHELLHDEQLMREFMAMPRGWVIRLGPRGEEVEYNVEDIVNARLGIQTPSSASYNDEPIKPDPCNTPRPSTPFCNSDRSFVRATIAWVGMYDDLDYQESQERLTRSQSQSAGPSSSSTTASRPPLTRGGMTRAMSLDTGLSEQTKRQPSVIWQTPYQDAMSKEDLGQAIDEQAARDEAKAKERAARRALAEFNVCGSDCEDDDGPGSASKPLFSPLASDDDDEGEGNQSSKPETCEDSPYRPAPFRAWNDIYSDEEEDKVVEDKGKGKTQDVEKENHEANGHQTPPASCESSPWKPSPYRAWNDVSSDEEDKEEEVGGQEQPVPAKIEDASTANPIDAIDLVDSAKEDVFGSGTPARILFKPSDKDDETGRVPTNTTLANSLFKPCTDDSTDEDVDSDAELDSVTANVLSRAFVARTLPQNTHQDDGETTEEDEMPAIDRIPLVRHPNDAEVRVIPHEPGWSSEDDGDEGDDSGSEEENDGGPNSRLKSAFHNADSDTDELEDSPAYHAILRELQRRAGVEESDGDEDGGDEDENEDDDTEHQDQDDGEDKSDDDADYGGNYDHDDNDNEDGDDNGDDYNDNQQDDGDNGDDRNEHQNEDMKTDDKEEDKITGVGDDHDKKDMSKKVKAVKDGAEADDEEDGEDAESDFDNSILPDGVASIDDDGWRRIVTYTNGVKVFSGTKYWRWFPVIPNKVVSTPNFDQPDSADEYELDDEPVEWYKGETPPTPRWPPPKSYHGEPFNACQYNESMEECHSEDEYVPGPDVVCGRVTMEFHARQLSEKLARVERWRAQTPLLKLSVNWAVRFGYRDPWL